MFDYSMTHLDAEEKYLSKIGFPYILEHIEMHKMYKKKITLLCNKIKSGSVHVHYEIFNYLKDWWTNHILKEDFKYFNFISQQQ